MLVVLFLVTISFVICKYIPVLRMIWKRSLKLTNPLGGLEIVRNVVRSSVYSVATYFVAKANIVIVAMMKFSGSLVVRIMGSRLVVTLK